MKGAPECISGFHLGWTKWGNQERQATPSQLL